MSKYLIVNKIGDLRIENTRLGIPRTREDSRYSFLRYTDPKDNVRKHLLLRSPEAIIGNFQWGSKDQQGNIHSAYLDLYMGDSKDCEKFTKSINRLDTYFIRKIWENRTAWGYSKDTPLLEIEKHWIPTVNISNIDHCSNSIKFEIPVDSYGSKNSLELELFDQDKVELPIPLLRSEYPASGLMIFKGVVHSGPFFYLDWELKQLMVNIPDQVFDGCQLSLSEDEDDDKPIWEIYEEYGLLQPVEVID